MKLRKSPGDGLPDKVDQQMTPMIDIVFQLLTFFVMSFKVVSPEGDFNIKMPLSAPSAGAPDPNQLPPIKVKLHANGAGALTTIQMNDKVLPNFGALHNNLISIVGDERGPGSIAESAEVELDCDYGLQYKHVISAITAVSGYKDGEKIGKLIEKIKFTPPKKGG